MVKGKVIIRGPRVQDIGYRLFLLNVASDIGLTGFQARNVDNDSVEVFYEGSRQKAEEFMETIRKLAPKKAEVSSIKFEKYTGVVKPIEVFRSEFSTIQLGKIVEVGVEMLEKQDMMLGKMDSMLEKQDMMLGKMDSMLEKQDETLGKQDTMLGKMDLMLEKQDRMLEKQDVMIGKIDELGNKIDNVGNKVDGLGAKMDALREDLKSMLDRRLTILEKDMALVKEKLGIP
jgi:acylphosphatase